MSRYILVILLFFGAVLGIQAQNSLQFSRVVTLYGEVQAQETVVVATVPEGKVWKVEHASTPNNSNGSLYWVSPDDPQVIIGRSSFDSPMSNIWLEEGFIVRVRAYNSIVPFFFSILEFHVAE